MNIHKLLKKRTFTERLIMFLVIAGLVYASASYFYLFPTHNTGDSNHYFQLHNTYKEQGQGELFPEDVHYSFRARFLTPYLASFLPFDTQRNFWVLNFFALTAAAILFYEFLRKLKFNEILSLLGVSFFLLNHAIIKGAAVLIEPIMLLALVGGFYSLLTKQKFLFGVFALLGALNKDVALIMLPLYFIMTLNIIETIAVSFLPILFQFWTRISASVDSSNVFLQAQSANNIMLFFKSIIGRLLAIGGTFHFLFIFAILGYKDAHPFVKRSCWFLLVMPILWLISVSVDRMTFYFAPVIIPLALTFFKRYFKQK